MILLVLVRNIKKVYILGLEVYEVQFIFDVKGWFELFINKVKNYVYFYAYRFFKRNGRVSMKYKNWASDKIWFSDGFGLRILNGTSKGIFFLVRFEIKKLLDVKDLEEFIQKCKRFINEDRVWWFSFVINEKIFRENWAVVFVDKLSNAKRLEWQLDKLRKYRSVRQYF